MTAEQNEQTPSSLPDDNGSDGDTEFSRVIYPSATVIFEEGEVTDGAFLIVKGKVEIRKGMRSRHPRVLGSLGRGEVIGEMALFDGQPHMATAVAVTQVVATKISAREFNRRIHEMDPVLRSAVKLMVKRARQMADMLMEDKGDVDWYNWKRE